MGIDAQMLVKVKGKVEKEQLIKWAYELAAAFGSESFLINRESKEHCLTIIDEYKQDGDSIFPEKDETFIEVGLITRYYGEGYERGNLPFLIMVAEFLEIKIPNSQIWYGGDSSGIEALLFDKKRRNELFKYFVEFQHKPYRKGFATHNNPPICDFCKVSMTEYGWGEGSIHYRCDGCVYEKKEKTNG